jgi:DNA-binding HxlR family transcriptional regulator
MRIDPDLVRKIIILAEDETAQSKVVRNNQFEEKLSDYDSEVIYYHVRYLKEAGYFTDVSFNLTGGYIVYDLSPKGHTFAENIRNDTNWNRIKSTASKAGSFALDSLYKIAIDVASSVISKTITGQ